MYLRFKRRPRISTAPECVHCVRSHFTQVITQVCQKVRPLNASTQLRFGEAGSGNPRVLPLSFLEHAQLSEDAARKMSVVGRSFPGSVALWSSWVPGTRELNVLDLGMTQLDDAAAFLRLAWPPPINAEKTVGNNRGPFPAHVNHAVNTPPQRRGVARPGAHAPWSCLLGSPL